MGVYLLAAAAYAVFCCVLQAKPAPVYKPDTTRFIYEGKDVRLYFNGEMRDVTFHEGGTFTQRWTNSDIVNYGGRWLYFPSSHRLIVTQTSAYARDDTYGWTVILNPDGLSCGYWGGEGETLEVTFEEVKP